MTTPPTEDRESLINRVLGERQKDFWREFWRKVDEGERMDVYAIFDGFLLEVFEAAEARGRQEMLEKITAVLRDLRRKLEGITGKTDLASGALMIVEEIEDALSSENK